GPRPASRSAPSPGGWPSCSPWPPPSRGRPCGRSGYGPHVRLCVGQRSHDLTTRSLVMAILNRTPDSFFDKGEHAPMDKFLRRAEEVVADGADILDVGGVKAGPGPEVTEPEEIDRVLPAIEALHARFDVPISVDTLRASVAA